jgi:dienelactone hydrolase
LGLSANEVPAGTFIFDGKKVDYWQFEPGKKDKGKEPLPAIVLLHGIEGLDAVANNNQFDPATQLNYKMVCRIIAEKGYVVRFVHYMQGTAVAKDQVDKLKGQIKDSLFAPPEKVDPALRKLFEKWMACVKAGSDDFIKNAGKNGIEPERVGVVGLSMGGFVATSLAVKDPKFTPQALVIVCGGLPEELHAKVDKLPPVMMIYALKDEIVPLDHTNKVQSCLQKKNCLCHMAPFPCYHMFYDAPDGEKFNRPMALRAVEYAEVFLKQNVKNAPKDKVRELQKQRLETAESARNYLFKQLKDGAAGTDTGAFAKQLLDAAKLVFQARLDYYEGKPERTQAIEESIQEIEPIVEVFQQRFEKQMANSQYSYLLAQDHLLEMKIALEKARK